MRKVSIIIPTFKDWARLALCLKSLSEQSFDEKRIEIIVVNNDPLIDVPTNFSLPVNALIINEAKTGSYAARNAALKICTGEIIGFTDSDCIPDKDWIKNAVEILDGDSKISRLAGPVKIFTRGIKPQSVELYDLIYAFPQKNYVSQGLAVTANLFTYRSVFDIVGNFDDSTISGGDFEWAKRATSAGFAIHYADSVIVNHPARDSISALIDKAKRVGKGQLVFRKEKDNALKILREAVLVLRPKTWEIKRVFKEGKNLKISEKIQVIFLRHLVLWTSDFSRIKEKIKRL